MNLVVDQLPLNTDGTAVALAHPDDERYVFCVPWRGRSIVGTYNRDYPFDPTRPLQFEDGWIDELVAWLRPVHPDLEHLERRHVRFVHAGTLPRDDPAAVVPSDDPEINLLEDGSISVKGVKWTPAYGVSLRAIDLALEGEGRSDPDAAPTPLIDRGELLRAYRQRDTGASTSLPGSRGALTRSDVLFCVKREWAQTLEDVLMRRTGLASAGHPGRVLVQAVSEVLQEELGWSERERREQVGAFDASFHFAGNTPSE